RIALEVVTILESAGLALVDVDRHQPRRGLVAHDAPLAPGREAGAAQAAQARVLERLDDVLDFKLAGDAGLEQRVAALVLIALQVDEALRFVLRAAGLHGDLHRRAGRIGDRELPDGHRRRL